MCKFFMIYQWEKKNMALLQAYADVDQEGLYTLGSVVVDYRGIRVVAQTIVPGILEKQQEQSVIYGSNDYGKTVCSHPRCMKPESPISFYTNLKVFYSLKVTIM